VPKRVVQSFYDHRSAGSHWKEKETQQAHALGGAQGVKTKGGRKMIEPINKITCDWCGKFELSTTTTISKEFFLVSMRHASADKELEAVMESPEVEKFLLCTACRNAVESVKNLRMKERRQNKASQVANMNWSTIEPNYSVTDRVCGWSSKAFRQKTW
jgi:hypothetical protein